MRRLLVLLVAALGALPALSCRKNPVAPPSDGGILFIGNSLTGTNDLPAVVAAFYRDQGEPIEVGAVIRDGSSLEDQWDDPGPTAALAQIARGGWSVVVLQQGPSGLPSSRINLVEWTVAYDERIRAVGARTALFSVWPMSYRMSAFDSVAMSYQAAATEVDGIYLPVTRAWQEAWALDPTAPLYGPDGFHPSPAGTWLSAATIYAVLSGRSPTELPSTITTATGARIELTTELAGILKTAAARAAGSLPPARQR